VVIGGHRKKGQPRIANLQHLERDLENVDGGLQTALEEHER